jgi:two-component system sensor histidine kinase HydH
MQIQKQIKCSFGDVQINFGGNMYSKPSISFYDWAVRTVRLQLPKIATPGTLLKLEYVPWYSIIGVVIVVTFCAVFGSLISYYLEREIMDYDAVLTTQFVESVNNVESDAFRMSSQANLGQVLDRRTDLASIGMTAEKATDVRNQFFDHIRALPDLLMANVYTKDRVIVWSTNPSLIGNIGGDAHDMSAVFSRRAALANDYFGDNSHKSEQHFVAEAGAPYFESYIPLIDATGKVVAVVQIYKQPQSLMLAIRHGKQLIWGSIILAALFLYIAPFWIFRRADVAIKEQQERLGEAQTLCVIGEMSASVAHSIRNPLAAIRSSAELALDADPQAARKSAQDIIGQVDRLGKWIRELLVFSRPVSGERQEISLAHLVREFLPNFEMQLKQNRIATEIVMPTGELPLVAGNRALVNQALASVIGNAIEAMPNGGKLRVELQPDVKSKCIDLVVSDTGSGMTPMQIELAYKPFYTTKHNGVGLGIALVKRIMERFGGYIILRSKPGFGTQACLRFNMS